MYGVMLASPWMPIDGEDYDDDELTDGTQFRAKAQFDDLFTGSVEYWAILEEDDED